MTYFWRIPMADDYAAALGRSTYYFVWLEWGVRCIGRALDPTFEQAVRNLPAGPMADKLQQLALTTPHLDERARVLLLDLIARFKTQSKTRNRILHGHTGSNENQDQRIFYYDGQSNYEWTIERVDDASNAFQLLAVDVMDFFYGPLPAELRGPSAPQPSDPDLLG